MFACHDIGKMSAFCEERSAYSPVRIIPMVSAAVELVVLGCVVCLLPLVVLMTHL